jgi:SEFIR domain
MTYRAPKVFLTYTWESEEHKRWVKDLATRLRSSAGIDVTLDEWEVRLGEPFAHFM